MFNLNSARPNGALRWLTRGYKYHTPIGVKKPLPYSATFKDHLAHPRNVGELPEATAVAEEVNPMCGDRLRLSLSLHDERIKDVKYLAYGCPPTLVCGSVLTELIQGKKISEVRRLTKAELLQAVGGLPMRKHHAAALAIETLQSALKKPTTDYTDYTD
jgi:nitrogen fixation protein NifU and related proteins